MMVHLPCHPPAAPPLSAAAGDARRAVLDLANVRVKITCPAGRRRSVSLFEARLIELASPHCRRRLMCEDFIGLVQMAVRMSPEEFNGCIRISDLPEIRGNLA